MNTPFTNPLARKARAVLSEAPVSWLYEAEAERQRELQDAAQLYLDNLADGYDEPHELEAMLAEPEDSASEDEADHRYDLARDYADERSTWGMA